MPASEPRHIIPGSIAPHLDQSLDKILPNYQGKASSGYYTLRGERFPTISPDPFATAEPYRHPQIPNGQLSMDPPRLIAAAGRQESTSIPFHAYWISSSSQQSHTLCNQAAHN